MVGSGLCGGPRPPVSGRDSTTCRPFVSGRVGTACQPRSSPPGELGRGKALPCTPDEEGAAKPRPYLRELSSAL